jgi:hypothetical protein
MLVCNGKLPRWANFKFYLLYSVFGMSSLIRMKLFKNSKPVMFRVAKRIEKTSILTRKNTETNWGGIRDIF